MLLPLIRKFVIPNTQHFTPFCPGKKVKKARKKDTRPSWTSVLGSLLLEQFKFLYFDGLNVRELGVYTVLAAALVSTYFVIVGLLVGN